MKHILVISILIAIGIAACTTVPEDTVTDATQSESEVQTDSSASAAQATERRSDGEEADEEERDLKVASAKQAESETVELTESAEVERGESAAYRPVLVERMLPNGVIDTVTKISYDQTGRRTTEVIGSPGAPPSERIEYAYPSGHVVEVMRFDGDGRLESRTIRTLTNGMLTREEQIDAAGEVEIVSEYDIVRNEVAEWRLFGAAGELLSRSVYTYSEGDLVRVDNYDSNGSLQEYVSYAYSSDEVVFDAFNTTDNNRLSHTVRRLDSDGRVETLTVSGLDLKRTVEYAYDSNGNLESEAVYDSSRKLLYIVRQTYESADPRGGRR